MCIIKPDLHRGKYGNKIYIKYTHLTMLLFCLSICAQLLLHYLQRTYNISNLDVIIKSYCFNGNLQRVIQEYHLVTCINVLKCRNIGPK